MFANVHHDSTLWLSKPWQYNHGPLEYESVYLTLHKVAYTRFHIQVDDILIIKMKNVTLH